MLRQLESNVLEMTFLADDIHGAIVDRNYDQALDLLEEMQFIMNGVVDECEFRLENK